MKGVPPHHGFGEDGFGHLQVGVEYARLIALAEGVDPNFNAVVFLIHDIRWWDGEERRARRIEIDGRGQPGKESGKDIILPLLNAGKISEQEMEGALEAADKHSKLPSDDPRANPSNKTDS